MATRVDQWEVGADGSGDALAAWSRALAASHVSFELEESSLADGPVRGAVIRRRLGELALVDCSCSPFVGHRRRELLSPDNYERVGLQVVLSGSEQVRADGQTTLSGQGSVKLWTSWEPLDLEVIEPFAKRTLMFPLSRALEICPVLSSANVLPPLKQESGTVTLLVAYLHSLAGRVESLDDVAADSAARAALELLRGALEPSLPPTRIARRLALRSEIRHYALTHLQDPRLNPTSLARAHSISVRALHSLFEDSGESVAALIRRERLARCHADLLRPSAGTITEVAFRWGFMDFPHFSRLFKREYGVTPRDVRRAASAADEETATTSRRVQSV